MTPWNRMKHETSHVSAYIQVSCCKVYLFIKAYQWEKYFKLLKTSKHVVVVTPVNMEIALKELSQFSDSSGAELEKE